MTQTLPKDQWLTELRNFAKEWLGYDDRTADEYRDCDDWNIYYDGGYTPEEAVREDQSYA